MTSRKDSMNLGSASKQTLRLTNFQQEAEDSQIPTPFGVRNMNTTEYAKQMEDGRSGNIIMPHIGIEPEYAQSDTSFPHKDARKTSTVQYSQNNINASEYLDHVRQQEERNGIIRLKNIDKNQIFNQQDKHHVKQKSSQLAQQNYAAFGQKNVNDLIQTFVKRKESIGHQNKLKIREKLSMPLPSQEQQDKAVKESYKSFRRDGRKVLHFKSIYHEYSMPKQLQIAKRQSYKGQTQSLNRSSLYNKSIESPSPNPMNTNDFKLGVSFYQSGKKTIEHEEGDLQDDGVMRSLNCPRYPRETKISAQQNLNILYSAQRLQENKSQLKKQSDQPNFIYDLSAQEYQENSILLLQKQIQEKEASKMKTQQFLKMSRITANKTTLDNVQEKILPQVQDDFRRSAFDSLNPETYHTITPQKSNGFEQLTLQRIKQNQSQQKSFKQPASSLKQSMNDYQDTKPFLQQKRHSETNTNSMIAPMGIIQERSSFATNTRERSLPVHKKKPSFMTYKIPDLNSCHWYLQNQTGIIKAEQQRVQRQGESIENKLRYLTQEANTKFTTKEKQNTNAEEVFYEYVQNKVGQIGNISKNMLPKRLVYAQVM